MTDIQIVQRITTALVTLHEYSSGGSVPCERASGAPITLIGKRDIDHPHMRGNRQYRAPSEDAMVGWRLGIHC